MENYCSIQSRNNKLEEITMTGQKRKISFRPVEAYLKGTVLRGLQWGGVLDVNSRHLF